MPPITKGFRKKKNHFVDIIKAADDMWERRTIHYTKLKFMISMRLFEHQNCSDNTGEAQAMGVRVETSKK